MKHENSRGFRFLSGGMFLLFLFAAPFLLFSPCRGEETDRDLERGMYHESREEYAQAAAWYRRGAVLGVLEARHRLGLLCWKGQGVSQDNREAFMWFYLAAARGNLASSVMCATLRDVLTPEEIDQGRNQAREILAHEKEGAPE
jgi:TPR repeat protein